MANVQREILNVLINRLMEQGLIDQTVHDKAINLVYTTLDFPEFFDCFACCKKEDVANGCTQG